MRPRMLLLLVAVLLAALVWIAWRRVELVPRARALDPVADPRGGGAADALADASTRAARFPQASAQMATLDPAAVRSEHGNARSCVFHVQDARTHAPVESIGLEILVQHSLRLVPDWKLPALPLAVHPGGMLERLVPIASCQVVVEAAGYAALEEEIGDRTDVTLALCRESSIRGRLVLDGRPVASAKVEVERELIDQWGDIVDYVSGEFGVMRTDVPEFVGRRRAVETGPDGLFVVSGLARGTYSLRFNAPASPEEHPRGLKVPFEDALDLGDIALEHEAVVHGRLLRDPGDAHRCYCVYFDRSVVASVRIVDEACTFEFRKLRAGRHSIGFGTTPLESGAGMSSSIPRVTSFELAAGEVREMDLDATACKPCEVIVHVVRDGHPTPGVNVEARARLDEFGVIHRLRLGTSGEDGIVRGELDGDARFELIACGENGLPLADGEAGLTAQPGGSIERTLEIRSGTLRIELPKSVFWRFSDQIVVDLHGRGQAPIRRTIRANDLVAFHTQIQEHTLVFEKLRVGAYEGHLHLEHDVSVVSSGESGAKASNTDLLVDYVVIQGDRETMTVVH